jgi:hypothetical protein
MVRKSTNHQPPDNPRDTFDPSAFTAIRDEDVDAIAQIKAGLVDFYQPANSEELFAVERIALARHSLLRTYRMESGLVSYGLQKALQVPGVPRLLHDPERPEPPATTGQEQSFWMAAGFVDVNKTSNWQWFLRYQAQAERLYRRAVEEFERLRRPRGRPAQTIVEPAPEPEAEPAQKPPAAQPSVPEKPLDNPPAQPAAVPHRRHSSRHSSCKIVLKPRPHQHILVHAPLASFLPQTPLPLKSEFRQHPPGRRIANHVIRANSVQLEIGETEVNHGAGGLGSKAVPPVGSPQPKAQISRVVFPVDPPDARVADERAVPAAEEHRKVHAPAGRRFRHRLQNPRPRRRFSQRMRNRNRGVRDGSFPGHVPKRIQVVLRQRRQEQSRCG